MEKLPLTPAQTSIEVVPYADIPFDWMSPGEVARTFGLTTEPPELPTFDQATTGENTQPKQPERRAQLYGRSARPSGVIVKAIAHLGLEHRLGRLEDGRVTRYIVPTEANQVFDHLFGDKTV